MRARWWLFAIVLAADVLDLIDATVTTVAAPIIVRDLVGDASLVPWLGLSYALALGSLLVVGARLGDRFGQRRTFLVGLVGFTLASLSCGAAWSPVAIVAFRLVQGAFGALLIPQGFSMLLRAFPRAELGRAFGLFGPLMAIGSIGGPVLAGLLIQADIVGVGWRSIFLITGVIGGALLVAAVRVLPAGDGDPSVRIDPGSSAAIMLGLLGLIGGVIVGGENGWGSPPVAAIAVGAVFLAVFVRLQRRSSTPLLEPSLFRVRTFIAGVTVRTVFFAAVSGLLYVVSLFLQIGEGLSPFETAGIMVVLSVGIIATSFGLREHIQRLGRRLVLVGILVTIAGILGFLGAVVGLPGKNVLLVGPLLIAGLGMGCCFGSLFATALGDVHEDEAGSASGTLNALQQVANAVGAALVSTVFLALGSGTDTRTATLASLGIIGAILVVAACLTPLLPRHAAADRH
ncbi:MFS transporter [Streptosporangium amethystogenes]|uniref:MFS transporter n=1 Tax=Streptosporangium amethystogenes TaxID=2002 RepID=UPI0037A9CD07